jgi:hypothetical protein
LAVQACLYQINTKIVGGGDDDVDSKNLKKRLVFQNAVCNN